MHGKSLKRWEKGSEESVTSSPIQQAPIQQRLDIDPPNPALDKLDSLDPDEITPKQALDMLYQLKQLAKTYR